jgi:Raf kinase inhibitor-like YbhB/YbcL family protein
MKTLWPAGLVLGLAGTLIGCRPAATTPRTEPAGESVMKLSVSTSAFRSGEPIPKKHTGDGADVSPPLNFGAIPNQAVELALIVDDPDAPTPEPWVHWVLYKLAAGTTELKEGVATGATLNEPVGALQGLNSWGSTGYRGPAPPKGHGVHHYHFKLYALDTKVSLAAGADKKSLLNAMRGHILAEGELIGTYQR